MILARALGVLLLVLGLAPLANTIPGGHAAPWFADRLAMWSSGGAILVGVAAVTFIVLRRRPELWRDGAWARLAARWTAAGWRADLAVALAALGGYAVIARRVLSARPLLIDEIVQVWQARVLAAGHLWVPTPTQPEFSAIMHLVDLDGRRFGQFPVGGPLMLAMGTLLGAEWLVGPVFAAAGVLLWARLLRGIVSPGVGLAALLVLVVTPFYAFLGGSMMNHVTTTTWLLAAGVALARATRDAEARAGWAALAGLALGVAAMIRPIDAAAFALPTAAWLLWRARLGRAHIGALFASGAGIAVPLASLLAVNAQQTGEPLLFGYVALWGRSHELGFHEVPWGLPHTPLRGLELINLYLLRLQTYLFESPAPGLLFASGALLLGRGWHAMERWGVASALLLLGAYWAYWHDGFYLGPRFLLPIAPWLVLWSVRLPSALTAREIAAPLRQSVVVTGTLALALGLVLLAPIRWQQYRNGMLNVREDVPAALAAAGATRGTVLVRESWGSQLIARLWGIGVGRTEAERIYRTTDGCVLHHALRTAEATGARPEALLAALAPARGDTSGLGFLRGMPDTTVRVRTGISWSAACRALALEDTLGFAVYPPALLAERPGLAIVRDLHRRPASAAEPFWLLTKGRGVGTPLRVVPLDADSLREAWRDADDER